MTTDNLIGKSKLTKVVKPLILPRHIAVKRAQELKEKPKENKLTPEEKETMNRMEKEAKVFKDYRVGDLRSRLPQPTGWRILVMPYRRKEKTKKGIILPDQALEKEHVATVCAYVLEVGPDAYNDKEKFLSLIHI